MQNVCPQCWRPSSTATQRCPEHDLAPIADRSGQLVAGRYLIGRLIGLGTGLTTVWHAQDTQQLRSVALKIVPLEDAPELVRTRHGISISAGFDHEHIARVYEHGFTETGALYCAMERLRGRSLQRVIEQRPLRLGDALAVADQILRALEHIHEARIIHRDIKPTNLYIDLTQRDRWRVKLLDFGIACHMDMVWLGDPTGRIVGTPEYLAPEQVLAGPLDQRTDLYQFGVVLYRMLTGRLPFTAHSRRGLYEAHLEAPVPPMYTVAPDRDLPLSAERLVQRLLAKDRAHRPASASEVRRALRDLAGEPQAARRRPATTRLSMPVTEELGT